MYKIYVIEAMREAANVLRQELYILEERIREKEYEVMEKGGDITLCADYSVGEKEEH